MPYNTHELIRVEDDRLTKLGDVIYFLKTRKVNMEQDCEFQISIDQHPITPAELHELTELSCEVALTENEGKIILTTGSEHNMYGGDAYEERRHHSRLSLHTHHEYPDGRDESTLSFFDVLDSTFVSKRTPLLLVSPTGIMMYHAPTFNPLTNKRFRGNTTEFILKYSQAKKCSVVNKEWQAELQRQFAIDTKMIVQEVQWSDTAGIQKMMDIINLTSQFQWREVPGSLKF